MKSNKANKADSALEWVASLSLIALFSFGLVSLFPEIGILYVISALIFMLFCGALAGSRGRSGAAGFIVGFLFGFLGVIYYIAVGDSVELRIKKEEDARSKYQNEHKV